METARLKNEQTKSEAVSDRSRKTAEPATANSNWPLNLNDANSPALRLDHAFRALVTPLGPLQAKLTVNQPGDQYEQEADRVAEQVMRMPDKTPRLQRKCGCGGSGTSGGSCEECASEQVLMPSRMMPRANSETRVPNIVHEVLRSSGQPLDQSTRAFMEARLGRDFAHVRVHADARAAESARAVNALAYTVGRDMVFAAGRYAPTDATGRHLISHELTHVIQQSHASQTALPLRIDDSHAHEQEATQNARAIGAGQRVGAASPVATRQLARFSDTGHHVIEEAGLAGAGFSARQIQAIERGNIQRDYSQIGAVGNFLLLCQPQNFGGYEAAEHFDNYIFDAITNRWRTRGAGRPFLHQDPNTPDRTPIDYIESQLLRLANAGMTDASLVHLGDAFHTVEDFFAHSNFVELINNEVQGDQALLTGSVPGTEAASVSHVLADISGSPMREYYERQAEAATARTEPHSHARMAHDTPGTHNYEQARRLAALVVQDLGADVLAVMQQPQADQRAQLMSSNVLAKIRRYLQPPRQNDRWWEQLTTRDAGAIDRRLTEAAQHTPVTVNQCVFSPLRNLEASSTSSWRLPVGVALPVRLGSNQIWIQGGVGVTTPLPLDRSLREAPVRSDEQPALIGGIQVTGRF